MRRLVGAAVAALTLAPPATRPVTLAGPMTWSINWDGYTGWEFSHSNNDYVG